MRNLLAAFIIAPALALSSGCTFLRSFADRIGSAVERYCEEPQASRELLREYLNARTAPNGVYVVCEGDEAPPSETPPAQ